MTLEEVKLIIAEHQKWLNDEGGARADLSGADLSRADLSGADLYGANLYGANLSGADLSGADLSGANLYGANLSGADLSGADLSGADLSGAYLSGADLHGANAIIAFGPMPTSGRIIYAARHDEGVIMVNAGCFWGTVAALRAKVKEEHNCPVYLGFCDILDSETFKFYGE